MTATLGNLREEHRELLPRIEALKDAADLAELAPVEEVVKELEAAYLFLEQHVLPHARAEEETLYRAYDQVASSPWATDTMRRDHNEIERLTKDLLALRQAVSMNPLTSEQKNELGRVMYGLYAVLTLHLRHEEELILPRIEAAITQEAADQIIASMAETEARLKDVI